MASENFAITRKHRAVPPPVTITRVSATRVWFAPIVLFQTVALMLTALAYSGNRSGESWATGLFWLSLIMIFVPAALRIAQPSIPRKERLGLVLATGLALYLIKVLYTPQAFAFHDEFLHWRTANDILLTGRLFTPNPILTVSPLYPGLEIATTALANLSGLTVVESGLVLLGVVRLMFMLVLYLFYEQVGHSAQVGGIAALLYLGNSNFLYFDSQYSYESLSLPLATAVLYITLLQHRSRGRGFIRFLLLVVPIIISVALTHHLTAYVMAFLLLGWAGIAALMKRSRRESIHIGIIAILAFIIVIAWTLFTGNVAEDYLLPVIGGGIAEFMRLILNEESGRQLFRGAAGLVTPLWERIVGILAVVAIVVMLPFGLYEIWRSPFKDRAASNNLHLLKARTLEAWYRYKNNAVAILFAGLVFLYPLMLAFRFTSSGWEIANRSSEFIFWALAFILAIGALGIQSFRIPKRIWMGGLIVWMTIIFLGGSIAGWPSWARLPGPYIVSADARSIEPQSIAAASWAGDHLNPRERIAADRINTLLLATYGHLMPVTHQYDSLYISTVFLSPHIGPVEFDLLERTQLRYALVDNRITSGLPAVGVYFEAGEPNANEYVVPPSPAVLEKFDAFSDISRIFDSGSIKIYDVGMLSHDTP